MVEQWPGDSPAAWIDDIGHAIAERYRAIEDSLRETLERLAEQHLATPDDLIARYRAIQDLREQAERLVMQVDPAKLAKWATEEAAMGASAEIARQLLDFPAYAAMGVSKVTSLTAGGAYAVAAVELDLRDALRALNARILRAPADAYQAMTSKHVGSLLTGMTTSQALHRRILDEYLADGITGFTDKSGRRWTIGAYSEMATRTAAHRAWGDQAVASMRGAGITTYTPVVGNSACSPCAQWIGKTLTNDGMIGDRTVPHAITAEPTTTRIDATLDEWRASKAGHPNCRCVMAPSLPGGPDPTKHSTWDKQKEQDRERLRELERDVRQAKRDGDPDKIGKAQAALREHVEKTGITRRGYREQLPFADGGDTNPRGNYKPTPKPREYKTATKAMAEALPPDLTDAQRDALTKWTGGYHRDIQAFLRGSAEPTVITRELAQSIDSAMRGHRLAADTELFRIESGGIAFGVSDITNISAAKGKEFTWRGLTATTYPGNTDVATQLRQVGVTIRAPKGTHGLPIAAISEYPTEGEILLDRGLRVRVLEVTYNQETGVAEVIAEIIGGRKHGS